MDKRADRTIWKQRKKRRTSHRQALNCYFIYLMHTIYFLFFFPFLLLTFLNEASYTSHLFPFSFFLSQFPIPISSTYRRAVMKSLNATMSILRRAPDVVSSSSSSLPFLYLLPQLLLYLLLPYVKRRPSKYSTIQISSLPDLLCRPIATLSDLDNTPRDIPRDLPRDIPRVIHLVPFLAIFFF